MLSRWPTGRRLAFSPCSASRWRCPSPCLRKDSPLRAGCGRWRCWRSSSPAGRSPRGHRPDRLALANYQDPEDEAEFERIVIRSERLARENLAAEPDEVEFMELDPFNPDDFETLVREALDDLPDLLIKALDRVPVVISDKGRKAGPTGSTRATRSPGTTTTTGSSSSATRCCATSGTTRTCCAHRSRARFATSWPTTWVRTSSGCARWACK